MKFPNETKTYRAARNKLLSYPDIRDLKGVIQKPTKPVSVEDMNKAVRRHAVRS